MSVATLVNINLNGAQKTIMYPYIQYIWGPDRALAQIDKLTNTAYYYLYNGHGDVVQITDTAGNVVNKYDYDVWGNFLTKEETIDNPFTYFGQTYDETTGLYYLRARYYDPSTGRFTQQDPAEDGYNWYVYGNQNPVVFVDPVGQDAIVVTTGTMSVYGNAHTSVLVQDYGDNWYYFYWGNKNALLMEVPTNSLTNLDAFNTWLIENGAGKQGKETDQPLHDSSDAYTTATYIEGDFSASVGYFLEQVSGADIAEEIQGDKHKYKNNSYDLLVNNCMTVSFAGLSESSLLDGTNFGDFVKFNGVGSVRPNDFRVVIRETFANQEFTKAAAKNSAIGNVGAKRPWYMSRNYYNRGQNYGEILRGN